MSVRISKEVSVAFRDSVHPFGQGANLKASFTFELLQQKPLAELQSAISKELRHWDHKHLGLDMMPQSYSAYEFALELKKRMKDLRPLKVRLAQENGWSLEV